MRDASKASAAFWQALDGKPSLNTSAKEEEGSSSHYDESLVLDTAPNDIFRLVQELRRCLAELGVSAEDVKDRNRDVESWACLIYGSMSAPSRTFHDVGHVFDISRGADCIQTISALFHDVIYYTIDGGLSTAQAKVLDGVIVEKHDDSAVSLSETICSEDKHVAMVVTVFGFNPGQVLSPFKGLNEFLSAVLAVRCLKETLHDSYLLRIAACIEATVPFRKADENGRTPLDGLHERVCKANADMESGLTEFQIVLAIQRAADLANRDVTNFATKDHAQFLSNTWKLLPESNISLRSDGTGHISSFVIALKKMLGFLENLDPSDIYGSYQNEPSDDVMRNLTERARRNISIATRYLRLKVLGLSLIAALAELTGGDAPLIMFVRGMTVDEPKDKHSHQNMKKAMEAGNGSAEQKQGNSRTSYIANFGTVQRTSSRRDCDEEVYSLLKCGRKVESKFDLINSPVAAYLYGILGDTMCDRSFDFCACPMDSTNAKKLLDSLPPDDVAFIARSCSRIVLTRAEQLIGIANVYSEHCPSFQGNHQQ
mmetsp:Transcript_25327/g.37390  ORF Transcript_25327/g.37390 Transcript_25327/m.37390 type:complete len:542 (+) Transcript_25327:219-1844(+)